MVVGEPNINNIMGGIENTGSVRLHNHRKKLKQRFDIIKKLGQGTYGKVQLGINKETGQEVAIKTIKKSKIETEADLIRIRREIQIMSSVQHPNIIHIYEVFENREKMVLVMEYAAGGELYDYLSERKVLSEEEARRIFRQISTACYYCHKHKICHRDLKLENILLDEQGNAKIADFGLSNVFDDQRLLSTFCGSPLYASPEIVKGTPYQGPEVDCWSLGVLLYTLVYGAMPFDGSNFKQLVRQISQGDYFEPKKPSRASPLIRDMLTVNPRYRANIEKICAHWWVNEGYDESCLDISEDLANQTPVRLDLLLSLAPPPPQLESEKLVVTADASNDTNANSETAVPTRSQSAGSIMELVNPAERRIKDLLSDDVKMSPKRKLETTVSNDQVNLAKDGVKRKEKIVKENTIADITLYGPIQEDVSLEDASMSEMVQVLKSATQTLSRDMDVEQSTEQAGDLSTQGAACTEILEDVKKEQDKMSKKTLEVLEEKSENSSKENVLNHVDKENVKGISKDDKIEDKQKSEQSKIPAKKKTVKKKVLSDKNDNLEQKNEKPEKAQPETNVQQKSENKTEVEEIVTQPPNKPIERRRSRIFETAEKFQNMITANENKPVLNEKPKKMIIPGVSVGGYKKEFERKANLTTSSKTNLFKKSSIDQEESTETVPKEKPTLTPEVGKSERKFPTQNDVNKTDVSTKNHTNEELERRTKVQNAVNIISNALDKDGARKSKSRPCMTKKPPMPFGLSGRSASASITTVPLPQSPPASSSQTGTKEFPSSDASSSKPAQVVDQTNEEIPEENKTSSAEITLKSATLPRRKTTKAEIKLDFPAPQPATMGFKTEMSHRVEGPSKLPTQRSEVTFPISSPTSVNSFRSASLDPETKVTQPPRERIIPISFEREDFEDKKESVSSPLPSKPPTSKFYQTQRSTVSQRSNSLSRQSTQESDSETTVSTGEPIRKSPREYIIPIAVEGGGYVTPRAGSLEPSETASTTSTMTGKSIFGRNKGLLDREGSEEESPFAALHRHSSFGRDSDTEDKRDIFRMHSLRSSRPRKAAIEHNDSFSSGEDDDDDGFEILTAENLFSTLLSRVRDLTQRLNVDGRPGFPSSRLLSSHFDHGTNFWNLHSRPDRLSRFSPAGRSVSREQSVDSSVSNRSATTPWRRSVSRDLASDIESVFNNSLDSPTHTATLPRGAENLECAKTITIAETNQENLNLTDLNLKKLKLSEEDALALSYLTPGLSRRIQNQLLAQLAPSEARKLSRTLSMRNTQSSSCKESNLERASVDRTLPRRFSVESNQNRNEDTSNNEEVIHLPRPPSKSFLPVKSLSHDYYQSRKLHPDSKSNNCSLHSPDSSTSDSLSNSNFSEPSRLSKYLSPSSSLKYSESLPRSYTPTVFEAERCKSPSSRKTSRFLRPDFYDTTKDSNYYLKEKKEREMETQKVLKEIRDKRKSRFRERSASRENHKIDHDIKVEKLEENIGSTDNLLKNVSDNIKKIESNVKELHDYVNIIDVKKLPEYVNIDSGNNSNKSNIKNENPVVVKKERPSKIARPKSYPTETTIKQSKISKLKKPVKVKESAIEKQPTSKNKFLQTIEKKFEKLRSFSNSPNSVSSEEAKIKEEKKSIVEDTIKRLREQSLPRNLNHCITTESGLIKRAVSVEDLTASDSKQLQASRKSVTKILNLFKKYEDKDNSKKNEKATKSKKIKEESKKKKDDAKKTVKNKSQLNNEKTDEGAEAVITNDQREDKSDTYSLENVKEKKTERPQSLLLEPSKQFQPNYDGAKSDSNILAVKDLKTKGSKLPVTSYRRSLNLENNTQFNPGALYNKDVKTETQVPHKTENAKPDRKNLKLDLKIISPTPSTSTDGRGRNSNCISFVPTNDGHGFLSPYDDNVSCDSWSVCSDYHPHEIMSPVSPCGNFYSADENESVSDRILRKSFYTRFNEKKRPRKSLLGNYRDLDLYKDMNSRKSMYNSLDRQPADRKSSYYVAPEPLKKDKQDKNAANRALNDGYVNVPNRYHQTYNSRFGRCVSSVYDTDSEEINPLDDLFSTGKNRMYSDCNQPSIYANGLFALATDNVSKVERSSSSSVSPHAVHSSTAQNLA